VSVATFLAAACDGEDSGNREVVDVRLAMKEGQPAESDLLAVVNTPTTVAQVSGTVAICESETATKRRAEATSVISDDAPMSIGDSDEEESESGGSDGFSQSGSSISCGNSTLSRGSRKRPADESPERESGKVPRQEFLGLVTRSEGRCRVYVPPTGRRNETNAMCAADVTPMVGLTTTTNEATTGDVTDATCATDAKSATAPTLTVDTTIAACATDAACTIDVATSEVATEIPTETSLVPTGAPTRGQPGIKTSSTCWTSLVSIVTLRPSTPEPGTMVCTLLWSQLL